MNLRPPGYELCFKVRFEHFPFFPEIFYPKSNAFPLSFLRCLHCLFPVLGQVMGQAEDRSADKGLTDCTSVCKEKLAGKSDL